MCVSVGIVGSSRNAWILSPLLLLRLLFSSTHTPLIFTVTHHSSQRPIAASPPLNCLHLRHSVCVAMAIPQCSTHTVSPSLRAWSQLAADDAGRLQTSSLPLGREPIFTTGHKVYRAAQHIYGTASNHSTARKTLPSSYPLFASQEHCTIHSNSNFKCSICLLLEERRITPSRSPSAWRL